MASDFRDFLILSLRDALAQHGNYAYDTTCLAVRNQSLILSYFLSSRRPQLVID